MNWRNLMIDSNGCFVHFFGRKCYLIASSLHFIDIFFDKLQSVHVLLLCKQNPYDIFSQRRR